MRMLGLALAMLLAACADYPRDIEGTSEGIAKRGTVRVGLVLGTPEGQLDRFYEALSDHTGPAFVIERGSAEPLLVELKQGQFDVVLAEVSKDTPWVDDVAVIEPIATRRLGEDEIRLSPIARNGENRWVMTLERAVRDLRKAPIEGQP